MRARHGLCSNGMYALRNVRCGMQDSVAGCAAGKAAGAVVIAIPDTRLPVVRTLTANIGAPLPSHDGVGVVLINCKPCRICLQR